MKCLSKVLDGTSSGPNLGTYVGNLLPTDPAKPVVTSTGNIITVWFNTTAYPGSVINFFAHYMISKLCIRKILTRIINKKLLYFAYFMNFFLRFNSMSFGLQSRKMF